MAFVLLLPAILSLILLSAHGMRLEIPILMVVPLAILTLLAWPRRWTARLTQAVLVLGALEWVRAALVYISQRQQMGTPWVRLAIILGAVSLFTLLSAVVFQTKTLRRRYRFD